MRRSGTADLPLHGGRVPLWLADRMARLGAAMAEAIVRDYGSSGFLTRLSDPCWFQAFGAVLGMDWHSSGVTTAVMGALKRGLNPRAHEFGLHICGGRGRHSRQTPAELDAVSGRLGLDGDALVRASRLTARVDNNAIGDGFQIYLHSFVVTETGEWAVIQQGLNERRRTARRYHWHSADVRDFCCEPHTAIVGQPTGTIQNLVDRAAAPAQAAMLAIAREPPDRTLCEVRTLVLPSHHDVRADNVDLTRLGAVLATAYERDLRDFASLLLVEKLHGAPTRFADPARFAFALGGKDGHPCPVPLQIYDEAAAFLRRALDGAAVGRTDKLDGLGRLDRFIRAVEVRYAPTADFEAVVAHERELSPRVGGRTVFDDRRKRARQPSLF
jgi:hypothetical protein